MTTWEKSMISQRLKKNDKPSDSFAKVDILSGKDHLFNFIFILVIIFAYLDQLTQQQAPKPAHIVLLIASSFYFFSMPVACALSSSCS